MSTREHWQDVHATRSARELSRYQAVPAQSLALIERAGIPKHDPLIIS
jgi:hypothetical protein